MDHRRQSKDSVSYSKLFNLEVCVKAFCFYQLVFFLFYIIMAEKLLLFFASASCAEFCVYSSFVFCQFLWGVRIGYVEFIFFGFAIVYLVDIFYVIKDFIVVFIFIIIFGLYCSL